MQNKHFRVEKTGGTTRGIPAAFRGGLGDQGRVIRHRYPAAAMGAKNKFVEKFLWRFEHGAGVWLSGTEI